MDLHQDKCLQFLPIVEAFSFYYARLVVFASEDERLISRWAQAEATRAEQVLTRDSDNLEIIAKTFISDIEKDIDLSQPNQPVSTANARKLRHSKDGNLWKIGMPDFIEICPKITGARWRLANSQINKGKITLYNEQQYSSSAKLAYHAQTSACLDADADAIFGLSNTIIHFPVTEQ